MTSDIHEIADQLCGLVNDLMDELEKHKIDVPAHIGEQFADIMEVLSDA